MKTWNRRRWLGLASAALVAPAAAMRGRAAAAPQPTPPAAAAPLPLDQFQPRSMLNSTRKPGWSARGFR